ncbi:hypothetical protein KC363_g3884 [Hortaea werneckii]|nr:hypothetical protein KC361_g2098 [Hortaea werneckii]KAI6886705.1 hypothetical protein KC325_g2556 [Hortaea werneckii]KAI6996733.1 hypothetical protein KC359_g3288 [Hortaea werneckii]KAI7148022.1 hypothetical protein KC344_g2275 [Hortaea werneckii]KAI7177505.1 hypothetical protein KC360_g2238 [Hortaea werneckii]
MSFFARRINCHFCGNPSPYKKSSGIPEFQCTSCEAVNYLDGKGNILDTPAAIAAQSESRQQLPLSFSQELPETLNHQANQAFCDTCVRNQRIHMETLSNYLPDEDHPEYQKFEDALPTFKKELEQRYPQVCRRCAPKAQGVIHKADYYAGSQNVARKGKQVRLGGPKTKRQRDDWGKWSTRRLLGLVGLVYYVCLLAQMCWHAYGIFATPTSSDDQGDGTKEDPINAEILNATPKQCLQQSVQTSFNNSCYRLFGSYLSRVLFTTACLIWYHPGLRYWVHHTYRMESVAGWKEYFSLQVIMLAVRTLAYNKLSDPTFTADLTRPQVMAAHGFMIVFMLLVQSISNRLIKPVVLKFKMNMMPKPEERDVLGVNAGPESVHRTPKASSMKPSELFAKERVAPFPIQNLVPKSNSGRKKDAMPSPPPSDETDEENDPDAMDVDWSQQTSASHSRSSQPRKPSPKNNLGLRSMYNHGSTQGLGWSGMRDELFGIQDNMQLQRERKLHEENENKLRYQPPVAQSPFRGRLPQAPMSQERKLRNPPTQFSFRQTPASKQQNFLQQMRDGIEQGRGFARQQDHQRQQQQQERQQRQQRQRHQRSQQPPEYQYGGDTEDDEAEDFQSPAKNRTRGELQLRESQWRWAGDQPKDTGLEDLFGGKSFSLADEPAIGGTVAEGRTRQQDHRMLLRVGFILVVMAVVMAGFWAVKPVRRAFCLWLVGRLEGMGY